MGRISGLQYAEAYDGLRIRILGQAVKHDDDFSSDDSGAYLLEKRQPQYAGNGKRNNRTCR